MVDVYGYWNKEMQVQIKLLDMLITIVTVCYNDAANIEKTIKSVIGQTLKSIEYIVIDGGSSDGTYEIIKSYADKITVFISEKDNGIYDAMNKGIRLAKGEWINFMNSGDVFASNDILEKIVSSGLMNKCSFIYSDFYIEKKNSKRLIRQDYDKGKVLHQSTIYKRSLHNRIGMYLVTRPYIISDYLFFVQVGSNNVQKYNEPISINDTNGISMQGTWCQYQRICVDYLFRRINVKGLFTHLFIRLIKNAIKYIIK